MPILRGTIPPGDMGAPPTRPAKRLRLAPASASPQPHVAVVGAGAAGLAAAYFAAEAGARVTILEKNAEPGKKILISGGTRCVATAAAAGPPLPLNFLL